MPIFRSTLPALAAASLIAVGVGACGSDNVPGDSVAKVDGTSIKKTTFDHWVKIAAISSQGQTQPGAAPKPVSIPQPPDFAACVANKRKTAPKPAKGQPQPTPAQFKTQCKQEYEGLRDQVMEFLISAQWIQDEAKSRGVSASKQEVDKQFQTTKKQSFPKEKDFAAFLKSSGMNMDDLLFRVKIDTLSTKLRDKITKGKANVSPAQISAYYAKNKAKFAQPERRDLRIVLTKTKAKADQAVAALKGGQSFSKVAKKLSIDQASKSQGGKLLAVAKGQQEKALDTAVFKASKGKLTGPVKTQFGYYVFKVQKITKAQQQSEEQAAPTIKQLLASQNQQKALEAFVKDFQKQHKDKTICREGFLSQSCKNAPKPKTGTAAPGGAQQQAPPSGGQQVPPTGGGQQAPPTGGGQQVPPTGGGQQAPPTGTTGGG